MTFKTGGMVAEWITGPKGERLLRLGPPDAISGYRLSEEEANGLMDWLGESIFEQDREFDRNNPEFWQYVED